jgi:hypothetical protein
MPLVKLMNHTSYRDRITDLSLIPNLYVKLLPPLWVAQTLSVTDVADGDKEKEKKELKRRIKMFCKLL